jgi:hypothetical protein
MALSRNHCILVVKEGVPVKVKEEVLLTLMSSSSDLAVPLIPPYVI